MRFFRFLVGWWGSIAGSTLPAILTSAATIVQPVSYAATIVQPVTYEATQSP